MDYVFVSNRRKNAIRNTYTSFVHAVDADHKLLVTNVKFKLKVNPPKNHPQNMKLRKPDRLQLAQYNATVTQKATHELNISSATDLSFEQPSDILLQSAKETLPYKPPEQKKEYISQTTWELLELKWQAMENQDWDLAETISKDITIQAKKERKPPSRRVGGSLATRI